MLPGVCSLVKCVIGSLMRIIQHQLALWCHYTFSSPKINRDYCISKSISQFSSCHTIKNQPASLFVSVLLPPVLVHRGRHPAALFLHVHICLDVRGGPSHLPHADRATQHQLRRHEVLLRHRLGRPCHYHRWNTEVDLRDVSQSRGERSTSSRLCAHKYGYTRSHTHTHVNTQRDGESGCSDKGLY